MPKRKKEKIGFVSTISVPSEGSVGLTGSWRIFKPVLNEERCNKCLFCWIYCPEGCITKDLKINFDYCKGCGICAEECPAKAITMVKEEADETG
ncbi:MAG: ferredoxin [Candidatus Solincola sediminis]|uniref:Ferredoxin n=1 Tax=Candidatus Solincola sediminis TaxID=1797199 RepID=A0A1F2WQ14_9ACTN|nr:MAG: ferredoxin [Candidatus Solincola sediminis]OFW58967.1 MAG: ferredoxin [Candidatus Solincola sediminis]